MVDLPGNGNQNPSSPLRASAASCVRVIISLPSSATCGGHSRPLLFPNKKRDGRCHPFLFGAGNGNRTRIASLGSWSFAIRLYPRTRILYTKHLRLSRGFRNIFALKQRSGRPFSMLFGANSSGYIAPQIYLDRERRNLCTFGRP